MFLSSISKTCAELGFYEESEEDKEGAHTRPSATTQGACQLETLQAVTRLCFFSDNIQDRVDQFSSFCVMSLSPVISSSTLSEYKVVWSEDLPERSTPHTVHGAGLQVHQHGPGHVLAPSSLIVVHVDALQLKIRGSLV